MFFNLRYHIVSLVAVFLALGLGILIGIALPGDEVLSMRQQQLTGSLEKQLGTLRQKNQILQARIGTLEADSSIQRRFESQVTPVLVAGRLNGRRIAVIDTSGCGSTAGLAAVLRSAGAEIQSTTVVKGAGFENRSALQGKMKWPDMNEKSFWAAIAAEIAGAVTTGNAGGLNILSGEGFVLAGGAYGSPVDDVVIVGGGPEKSQARADVLDCALIDYFLSRKTNVYGVEESSAYRSCMKSYQKKGITTVDNIDTIPGQISLVYAISGMPGRYGIKPTARTLMPDINGGVPAGAR